MLYYVVVYTDISTKPMKVVKVKYYVGYANNYIKDTFEGISETSRCVFQR